MIIDNDGWAKVLEWKCSRAQIPRKYYMSAGLWLDCILFIVAVKLIVCFSLLAKSFSENFSWFGARSTIQLITQRVAFVAVDDLLARTLFLSLSLSCHFLFILFVSLSLSCLLSLSTFIFICCNSLLFTTYSSVFSSERRSIRSPSWSKNQ